MAVTTTTQIAAPVNVVYQTTLLRRAQMVCPYFVGSMAGEVRSHSGTFTVKWRRFEHLTPTTTPLAEITGSLAFPTRTAVQPSVTDVTATVQKYGNFVFLNEEVDLINITRVGDQIATVLGENAGRSLNRLQRNELEDGSTQVFFATGAATATSLGGNSNISLSRIANINNILDRNDAMRFLPETRGSQNIGTAPVRESYWGITHPDVGEDLRALTGWNSVETYAGQTETYPGEIGHVGGVRWIVTTEATIDLAGGATVTSTATGIGRTAGGTSYDVYNTVIMGKEAVGSLGLDANHIKEIYRSDDRLPAVMMITHPKGSAGAADPLNEVASVGWKSWHAAEILNTTWIRAARHTASKLTTA